jgi:hypothetical protein
MALTLLIEEQESQKVGEMSVEHWRPYPHKKRARGYKTGQKSNK